MSCKIAKCGGLKYDGTALKEINGVITYASETLLGGTAFTAPMCGGAKFDGGIFKNAKVGGKDVITILSETPDSYLRANCGLLFDADIFEIGEDGELTLANRGINITWDGSTEGRDKIDINGGFVYKVGDVFLTIEDLIGCTVSFSDGQTTVLSDEFVLEVIPNVIFIEEFGMSLKAGEYDFGEFVVEVPSDGVYLDKTSKDYYITSITKSI